MCSRRQTNTAVSRLRWWTCVTLHSLSDCLNYRYSTLQTVALISLTQFVCGLWRQQRCGLWIHILQCLHDQTRDTFDADKRTKTSNNSTSKCDLHWSEENDGRRQWIMLISVYIQRTKCFYCVVLYSVSFCRPSYFFSLLCLYYYCVILIFDVLYDMLVALVALCHL